MHEGGNPFSDEFYFFFFYFFLDSIIHISIFKASTEVLSYYRLKRPSGTYSPPAEASTQGLKCKTNTIPILMHQMRISTT
jgi:hypothetical protein